MLLNPLLLLILFDALFIQFPASLLFSLVLLDTLLVLLPTLLLLYSLRATLSFALPLLVGALL